VNTEPTQGEAAPKRPKTDWTNVKTLIMTIVLVLILIVIFQNFQTIRLRLFFWSVEVSMLLAGFVVLVIGFLLGLFTPRFYAKRKA
jgi:uncharacterized integral membrane protein